MDPPSNDSWQSWHQSGRASTMGPGKYVICLPILTNQTSIIWVNQQLPKQPDDHRICTVAQLQVKSCESQSSGQIIQNLMCDSGNPNIRPKFQAKPVILEESVPPLSYLSGKRLNVHITFMKTYEGATCVTYIQTSVVRKAAGAIQEYPLFEIHWANKPFQNTKHAPAKKIMKLVYS